MRAAKATRRAATLSKLLARERAMRLATQAEAQQAPSAAGAPTPAAAAAAAFMASGVDCQADGTASHSAGAAPAPAIDENGDQDREMQEEGVEDAAGGGQGAEGDQRRRGGARLPLDNLGLGDAPPPPAGTPAAPIASKVGPGAVRSRAFQLRGPRTGSQHGSVPGIEHHVTYS